MASAYIRLGIYEYNPADILGSGAFAIVYKGRFRDNKSQNVAIKQMIKGQNVLKSKTLLSKEISVLKDLNHEHIVRLYDHNISNSDVYLVMEFCNGGDLSEYLHCKKTLPEETIRHFLIQIGSAMHAMNIRAVMHRDLKPGNILLSYYGEYASVNDVPGPLITFKLADFGFARFLQDGIMAETMCGSPMYMAPEVLMCHKYDARADIWSMGIIVYQCFVGKAPFYANSPEALKNIYLKTIDLKPRIPRETSHNLRDLLLKMLIRKPADRIDFPSFLSHPFLTEKHISPSDLVPHKPASVPPLPSSVRRPRGSQSTGSRGTTSNRVYAAPALPSRRKTDVGGNRGRSTIAELMPTTARNLGRGSRIVQPTTVPRRESPATTAPPPPPLSPPLGLPSYSPPLLEGQEDFSDSSLTPTDDGNEYIEDGLGGSSFLVGGDRDIRQTPLSTEGLGTLDPCLADVLQRPRSLAANAQLPSQRVALDKSLEGYVIVESDGSEFEQSAATRPSLRTKAHSSRRGQPPPDYRSLLSPSSDNRHQSSNSKGKPQSGKPSLKCNEHRGSQEAGAPSRQSPDPAHAVQRQTVRADYNGSLVPPELTEEKLMEPEHKLELQTVTMVLELCELLAELAERRASALTDCTTTTTTAVAQPADSNGENSDSSLPNTPLQTQQHTKLKLVPEAKRIVEQLVLYRRILYYLEYVFAQVKKAVSENRLKPTSIAKKRLTDCNALYHRCYIRLCQLSRLSRREDLLEPVGRHLSRVTANRLIFNYALDQCFAAEMDDYIGDLGLALRRYRAAITLIHGLCQHATTQYDKSLLSDCLRMIQDRHGTLWAHVAGSGCRARGDEIQRRISNVGLDSPLAPSSVTSR
uniref:Protein kinase domain-containing protein n=3 Tax=Mesocestoides corti TaxID=53468 RepID=A0A5K3FBA1_MESCO